MANTDNKTTGSRGQAAGIMKVAVIGSGVMGSGIAAHIANSNTNVILLDIVPKDAKSRNQLTEGALEKMEKADPAMLTSPKKMKYIEIGNLEDDLKKLGECDWIIEVVLEDLAIKQATYKKINEYRKKGSIVSSNTSTIPLEKLTAGIGGDFEKDFLITHFFNPPRYMRLMELVVGSKTRKDAIEIIKNFCDVKLGKGVVACKDSPGFIANRIGTFWLTRALNEAIAQKTSVELADCMMGKPIGVPKTGVFGLMDLIGIDLMPLIAKSFASNLKADDEFNKIFNFPPVLQKMIADGFTGRKGKGGFYSMEKGEGGKKLKKSINLQTGEYSESKKAKPASAEAGRKSLSDIFAVGDEGSKYLWPVLRDTLVYAANLAGQIADEIKDIDDAMKLGYNWKYGPFELIDRFATKDKSGVQIFSEMLAKDGVAVPAILQKANNQPLYKVESSERKFYTLASNYKSIPFNPDAWMLEEIKLKSKPILKNGSASLWDVGDGVVCFEFTSKMNSLDPTILDLLVASTEEVKKNYKAMIIGNDGENFTVGANIGVLLFAANTAAWKEIDGIIKQGQDAYMGVKYAPFPVVGAPAGMALGGGCELLMHCDAVQAHVELYSGLVEVGVGFVPGWGGCKEYIYRHLKKRAESDAWAAKMGGWFSWLSPVKTLNTMPAFGDAMMNVSTAKVSRSAEEARSMLILRDCCGITMNRGRVLADAKKKALSLVPNYVPPTTYNVNLPGKSARTAMEMRMKDMRRNNQITEYDLVVTRACAWVLSGGNTDITKEVTEQQLLDLERETFVELVKNKGTLDRIEHMLETGKPLRN